MNKDLAASLKKLSETFKGIHLSINAFKKNTLKLKIEKEEPKDQAEADKLLEQL